MNNDPLIFESELRRVVRGDVAIDALTRGIYSTDASHYQITPQAVVVPLDEADCIAAIKVATQFGVAITPRGGGTSLSGQTSGPGLVIDTSKYMDQVLAVDPIAQTARVQPGVIRDRLNEQIATHILHFAPDPATGNRATVGGMIGNNASGTRSIVYGKTIDHVIACKVALADGTVVEFDEQHWAERATLGGKSGELHRAIEQLVAEHADEIRDRYPRVMRRVAGYNLDEFVDGAGYTGPIGQRESRGKNLSHLIVGSEGTLGFLLEATIRLTPLPSATALCVLHFDKALDSLRPLPEIIKHGPSAVELLDRIVLEQAKINAATRHLAHFIEGSPDAVLIVEFFGSDQAAADRQASDFAAAMARANVGYAQPLVTDRQRQADVWNLRKLGLGLISNVKGAVKGQAFVEDACVPIESLADYIEKLCDLCDSLDVNYSMYAHASVGVIHFRPMLDLHETEHRELMQRIADQAFEWVMEYGGVFSGEHGDGIVRGRFVDRQFGSRLYEVFGQVKSLFDPTGAMNPGKVIAAPSMIDPELLRYGKNYQRADVPTNYRYQEQGGFQLAVEQCNGVGACRKIGSGVMCPSYMATRDENHSTRGRANALRLAMSGQLGDTAEMALGSDAIHETLDLCLSCKACKSECPNAVDMSKLKADALQLRHDQHGASLGDWFVARMPDVARYASGFTAPLSNWFQRAKSVRWAMHKSMGIDRRRELPRLARSPVRSNGSAAQDADVVLFLDTYSRYFEPHVARAAIDLLEGCGLTVATPNVGCCQRPALSRGLLRYAKRRAEPMMQSLDTYAQQGLPIVCLEPSCASALIDDLPDLIDDREAGQRVSQSVRLLDAFIVEQGLAVKSRDREIALHGHCHQKAIVGMEATRQLFAGLPEVELHEIDSGCCGMAGSFGYTHHDLSQQIGEDRLFPAMRHAVSNNQTPVACGISCRHQLHDMLGVNCKHLAEVLEPADDQSRSAVAKR
jgi:FAD/FMN-containing dehydrogenase/Fe-S oxidoreductase